MKKAVIEHMLDITEPEDGVQVIIAKDGRLWVNVDGLCVLRVCRAQVIQLETPNGQIVDYVKE